MLGMAEREIVTVKRRRGGVVIAAYDGQPLIVVPVDRPDGAGRTGIMFFGEPPAGYRYGMYAYTRRSWRRSKSPAGGLSPAAAATGG